MRANDIPLILKIYRLLNFFTGILFLVIIIIFLVWINSELPQNEANDMVKLKPEVTLDQKAYQKFKELKDKKFFKKQEIDFELKDNIKNLFY